MLTEERRAAIVGVLRAEGRVDVNDLSRRFGTSQVTIRTDLKELHNRGSVFKTHGGAVLPELVSGEPSIHEKLALNAAEKARIGEAAAAIVADGDTIILDAGSTTQEIAKRIKNRKDLTVITNGLNIAGELAGTRGIQIILLGGVVRHGSFSIVGKFAQDMLGQLNADKLFIAADGCSLEFGISTPKLEESLVNQAMVAIAREKYLVADSSKFGKNSLSRIVSLWEMNGVICDRGLPAEYRAAIIERGIDLTLV